MRYDERYSWVRRREDLYEVGITKQSANESDEFVFVQLPEPGAHLSKGDAYVTIESVKSVSEVPSPISGTVEAVNMDVFDDPARINEDPENTWIMKVRIDDPEEYEALSK